MKYKVYQKIKYKKLNTIKINMQIILKYLIFI